MPRPPACRHHEPQQPRRPRANSPGALPSIVVFLLSAALLVGCPEPEPFSLVILHTNDTHARFLPTNQIGSTCRDEDRAERSCRGGVARRASLVADVRNQHPNVLLLDAGDQFQGTLFYSRFKGLVAQRTMNALGYDAMVLGNHEFDDGPPVLAEFAKGLEFPLLGANIDTSAEPLLAGLIESSTVVERSGRRIGIVGWITEETAQLSSPGPTVEFGAIQSAVEREVKSLTAQNIDVIIGLSHAGHRSDLEIARTVAGLDVIVGGHTNTRLSNTDEDAEGPYPEVVTGPEGDPVLVVTDFAWGHYLGQVTVEFDAKGRALTWEGEPRLLDSDVPENPAMAELLAPMTAEIATFAAGEAGSSTVDLIGRESICRARECNLGNLIADALLDAHREVGIEVALQNGGGIRASLPAGAISRGQVLEVLPFGNTVSTFGLLGRDLGAVLEHGVSQAHDLDLGGTGRFLQVAGLRYRFDVREPPGERVLSVEVQEADGSWQPLDRERTYRVAMNAFNRNGGDGYTVLAERAIDPYDQGATLAEVVTDYLVEHAPVEPTIDGRIVRIEN